MKQSIIGVTLAKQDQGEIIQTTLFYSKVVDGSEGREIQLISRKSLRSLTSQLLDLLMSQEDEEVDDGLRLDVLSDHYHLVYGTPLNPCEYGFLSLSELIKSLPYLVEVRRTFFLILKSCRFCSQSPLLIFACPQLYHRESDDDESENTTSGREEWVRLTRLYQFARNIWALLHTYHYNQIFLTDFHGAYNKFTGCCLDPRSYGYTSTDELLSAIPQVNLKRTDFSSC